MDGFFEEVGKYGPYLGWNAQQREAHRSLIVAPGVENVNKLLIFDFFIPKIFFLYLRLSFYESDH